MLALITAAAYIISHPRIADAESWIFKDLKRNDPFIPLVDERGNIRKNFDRPVVIEETMPKVDLMGISKINDVFYAIIDGELMKEGDTIKDKGIRIEKVTPDKVLVKFKDKDFVLLWETEKNQ